MEITREIDLVYEPTNVKNSRRFYGFAQISPCFRYDFYDFSLKSEGNRQHLICENLALICGEVF